MPATKPPTIAAADLPAVATAAEIAAFERVDVRTLRADLDAGKVPGAYRRGRSWRVNVSVYLSAIENSRTDRPHNGASGDVSAGEAADSCVVQMRGTP
jgi:hypothetical protein